MYHHIHSPEEMKRFGSEIAQSYSIVLLEGGLGA
jgi:tRNA A37 threonylcarbamoyladenosine biosynthesis protein TsaE